MKYCTLPNSLEIAHLNQGETSFLYREIFEDRIYEKNGIDLTPSSVVFDVGANIGLFALYLHQRYPGIRVIAFEPLPQICEILHANLTKYNVNAKIYRCGLSNVSGWQDFTYYPNMSVMSGAYADSAADEHVSRTFMTNVNPRASSVIKVLLKDKFVGQTVSCELRRISEIIADESIERIDLLKVDVEKSELDVLLGIENADWPKVRQLAVEVHDAGGRLDSIRAMLSSRGYRVSVSQDPALVNTGLVDLYAVAQT